MTVKTTAALIAVGLLGVTAPSLAWAGDLTVTLTGAHAGGGQVHAALYTRETFFRPGGLQQTVDPASGAVTIVFRDVPPGDYAFTAYHDEDGDGQMDRSPMGMPSEGWGMSNADQLMGPPTFDVLRFTVPASGVAISVPLHYSTGR
ncbi:MAG: DUF2141 domain-containing protein [Caulobacteraceae bacterium]|nr:DUF2141 domain-containing protein [Caulobacteraceae bacterium]